MVIYCLIKALEAVSGGSDSSFSFPSLLFSFRPFFSSVWVFSSPLFVCLVFSCPILLFSFPSFSFDYRRVLSPLPSFSSSSFLCAVTLPSSFPLSPNLVLILFCSLLSSSLLPLSLLSSSSLFSCHLFLLHLSPPLFFPSSSLLPFHLLIFSYSHSHHSSFVLLSYTSLIFSLSHLYSPLCFPSTIFFTPIKE